MRRTFGLLAALLTAAGPAAPLLLAAAPADAAAARPHGLHGPPPGNRAARGTAEHFTGIAFDACSAPPLSTMKAWWGHSRFKAVGVYIGGDNRACGQANLTASWVRSVTALGWRLLPVYIGSQAPCLKKKGKAHLIKASKAAAQGRTEARDAIRAATRLGLARPAPLYLDMEAYPRGNAGCSRAVQQFSAAWNRAVRDTGYISGYYSSTGSGVRDLVSTVRSGRAEPADLPDVLWYARWDGRATTTGDPAVPGSLWPDARIHQYRGNVTERHGGRALHIDVNAVDAPVAG